VGQRRDHAGRRRERADHADRMNPSPEAR
jgi:hypothetical protein